MNLKALAVFFSLITTPLAGAAGNPDVHVFGTTYTYSCGYFSRMAGEYEVVLHDDSLEWGTRVFLHFGKGQYEGTESTAKRSWDEKATVEAKAVSPYTWAAQTGELTLANRSSFLRYDTLEFVLEIRLQDGSVQWRRGNGSPMGFYAANIWAPSSSTCLGPDSPKPAARELEVRTVTRD